jgi:teichuronic acid biosynthesis glycosyltransferase TuaH
MNLVLEKDMIHSEKKNNPQDLSGRDIVIISLHPWYFPGGSNSKNIAQYLSKKNRVIYFNIPLKRKAYLSADQDPKIRPHREIVKNKGEKLKEISPNLWEYYPYALIESINWIPFTTAFKVVDYYNNWLFAREIKDGIRRLGFQNVILINDNDIYNGYFLKKLVSPDLYVYYFRDFLQGYSFWKRHTSVLEPKLLKSSDLVVTNSTIFAEYAKQFNPRSFYIGQGCNFEFFDYRKKFDIPAELNCLSRPLVGYIGALDSERLDLNILSSVAQARPDWNIILVGPEDAIFLQSSLHQIPNIHFLGPKPFEQLPSYLNSFDVCINPQLKNQITRGNYPLKIDEYLSLGKPVVATRTLAMKIFESHTYLADRVSEYPDLIETALREENPLRKQERINFAHSHSWENCINDLNIAILDTLQSSNRHSNKNIKPI